MTDLVARINEYLSVGGLFNPELMDHEKVRDLLIACRDRLNTAKGANAGVGHPALRQVGASQLHDTESESRHPAGGPADESSDLEPDAVVTNDNQPHWTAIVETQPNVTLPVGTRLVRIEKAQAWELMAKGRGKIIAEQERQCRHLKVTGEVGPEGKVIRETCDDCEAVLPPFTPAEDA